MPNLVFLTKRFSSTLCSLWNSVLKSKLYHQLLSLPRIMPLMSPSNCYSLFSGTSTFAFFSIFYFSGSSFLFFGFFTNNFFFKTSCSSGVMFKSITSSSVYVLSHVRHLILVLISLNALREKTWPQLHRATNLLKPLYQSLLIGQTMTFQDYLLSTSYGQICFNNSITCLMSVIFLMQLYFSWSLFSTRIWRSASQLKMKPRRHMAIGRVKRCFVRLQQRDRPTATDWGSGTQTFYFCLTSYLCPGMSPPSFPIIIIKTLVQMESEKMVEGEFKEERLSQVLTKNNEFSEIQINQRTQTEPIQIILQVPRKPIQVPSRFLSNQYFITSRPQYQRSCGMSSLVSIFNTLYSSLNGGKLHPLTVQEAYRKLNVIGAGSRGQQFRKGDTQVDLSNKSLHEYLNQLDFGYFTYNQTLTTWFKLLCRVFGVKGRAGYFYKMVGQNKTDLSSSEAKRQFVEKLSSGKVCFIYHAHDHYFCPVGYELKHEKDKINSDQIQDLWVIISETAARFAPMRVVPWSQIQLDLSTCYPQRYDIRNSDKGIHIPAGRENEPVGGTFHCLLSFQRCD